MARAYVFFTAGFEEAEAVVTVDILRRAGVETILVSIDETLEITGGHGIKVTTDVLLREAEIDGTSAETALVLPGGGVMGGYRANGVLARLLKDHAAKGGLIAAICIAPTFLAELGLLSGKTAVCYPSGEDVLKRNGAVIGESGEVCESGRIITSKGPGTAYRFGFAAARVLVGEEKTREVSEAMLL